MTGTLSVSGENDSGKVCPFNYVSDDGVTRTVMTSCMPNDKFEFKKYSCALLFHRCIHVSLLKSFDYRLLVK